MKLDHAFLAATIVCVPPILAQQVAQPRSATFDLRAIAMPGMAIAGHYFTSDTTIDHVALSDNGKVTFIARWSEDGIEHAAVFTADRLVAQDGDIVDGKHITAISKEASVAISDEGVVAWEAAYTNDGAEDTAGITHTGIFVESRLRFIPDPAAKHRNFIVTKDGWLLPEFLPRPALTFADSPRNSLGQFLISARVKKGFLLLLATPIAN
jgi:hypothetical protein